MSNESENKRIDLTQFEGIGDKRHLLLIEKTPTDGYHWSLGFESDVEASMSVSSEFGREISEEADRFYNSIDKLPYLIAELKRCYEEIDLVHRNLSIVRNALARGYPDIEEAIWKLIEASE